MCLLILCLFTGAATYPSLDSYVNDFAQMIDDDVEQDIELQATQLAQKTKAQVVVVTVSSLNGQSLEDYSYGLANSAQIGDKKLDNGILFIVSFDMHDRGVRIEVGRGLEGALPDGKVGRILDEYTMPYFIEEQYSTGVSQAVDIIINEIYIEFGQEPDPNYQPMGSTEEDLTFDEIISIIMFILVFVAIFSGGRRGRIRFFPIFFGSGHGGGFRGGSGGSFGGFSGGGGSFGGGGASRRF